MTDNTPKATSGPEIEKQRGVAFSVRKCVECGTEFMPTRKASRFCTTKPCKLAHQSRQLAQGVPLVPLVKAWAMTRHAKPGTRGAAINRYARREMTAIASLFNAADAEAGRGDVLDYVGALMDSNSLYIDRRRD
jgi:hypothetical protein